KRRSILRDSHRSNKRVELRLRRSFRLRLQRQDQPILTNGEPDSRRLRTSEHPRQSVVSAAAKQSVLRSQAASVRNRKLERRPRVVIKPAHKPRIHRISNAASIERREHLSKVLPARIVEEVRNPRQSADDLL